MSSLVKHWTAAEIAAMDAEFEPDADVVASASVRIRVRPVVIPGQAAPVATRRRCGPSPSPLAELNRARHDAATAAIVEAARRSLASSDPIGDRSREALQARVDHPHATLGQLADILGITKDQAAGRLRRGLEGSRSVRPTETVVPGVPAVGARVRVRTGRYRGRLGTLLRYEDVATGIVAREVRHPVVALFPTAQAAAVRVRVRTIEQVV